MKLQKLHGEIVWAIVVRFINENTSFSSVTFIPYNARVAGEVVYYKGGKRNNGEEEDISKEDFIKAFESI